MSTLFKYETSEIPNFRLRLPIFFSSLLESRSLILKGLFSITEQTWLKQTGYPQGIITFNINDVLNKNKNKPNEPVATVPQKDVIILLPYIVLHSNHITKRLKSCVNRFYSTVNVKVIFQNTRRIKSIFPYKYSPNWSQLSKVIYRASCWDCNYFYIGKTKRRLHDRKTEHFKAFLKLGTRHEQSLQRIRRL